MSPGNGEDTEFSSHCEKIKNKCREILELEYPLNEIHRSFQF